MTGGPVAFLEAELGRVEELAPEAVLRRVKADRQILAEHADDEGECATCAAEGDGGGIMFLGHVPYPCRTVRLLAEAWGWEKTT